MDNKPDIPARKSSRQFSSSSKSPSLPPPITPPKRTEQSPKRKREVSATQTSPSKKSLQQIQKEIADSNKIIQKPRLSMDSDVLQKMSENFSLRQMEIERLAADETISESDRENLKAQSHDYKDQIDQLSKHASTISLTAQDQETIRRKAFTQLLVNSRMGFDLQQYHYLGSRGPAQKKFGEDLVSYYNLLPTAEEVKSHTIVDMMWEVIIGEWFPKESFIAGHIYPYRTGPVAMQAIFGQDATDELFSPKNGLYVHQSIEPYLDVGFMVIVPDVPDQPTHQDLDSWQKTDPKEYKIRILHGTYNGQQIPKPTKNSFDIRTKGLIKDKMTFGDLDGKRLIWRNNNRPRARYLYYLYIYNVLKFIYAYRSDGAYQAIYPPQIGQAYWGSPGKYVRESMIQGLIDEMGNIIRPFVEEDPFVDTTEKGKGKAKEEQILTQAVLGLKTGDSEDEDSDEDEYERR